MKFKEFVQLDEASKTQKKLNKLAGQCAEMFDKVDDALMDWQDETDESYPDPLVKKYSKSLKEARMYFQLMEEYTRR